MSRKIFIIFAIVTLMVLDSIAGASGTCDAVLASQGSNYAHSNFEKLRQIMKEEVLGQDELIDKLIIALLVNGHVLVEGPTGTAKTRTIETLSKLIQSEFKRVQFTIATEPSELTGAEVFDHLRNEYRFRSGSLFSNFVLADEINRASPKTQSALLQAMEEKAITVSGVKHDLPEVYLVMATQNPAEHAGTFALPEAQMDRFMFKVKVQHPDSATESKILDLVMQEKLDPMSKRKLSPVLNLSEIQEARKEISKIKLSPVTHQYIIELIQATRNPLSFGSRQGGMIEEGAGTRATISLGLAARGQAWLKGNLEVSIADIDRVAKEVLRHRIKLSQQAKFENQDVDQLINELSQLVKKKLDLK